MTTQLANLYWADTFRQQMEARTVAEGLLIWSLSGASWAIRTPQTMIYLDPYLGGVPEAEMPNMYRCPAIPLDPRKVRVADAVLISHDHYDHCHRDTLLPLLEGTAAHFYGPESVVKLLRGYGIPEARIGLARPGDRFTIGDAEIVVWPGNDPGEKQAVCYTVASGGAKLFFAGDSLPTDYMATIGDLDIAMMAFGRIWYMDEAQLLEAVAKIKPRLLLPYHWDLWWGHTGDPLTLGRLIERAKPEFDTQLLLIGEWLHYVGAGRYERSGHK